MVVKIESSCIDDKPSDSSDSDDKKVCTTGVDRDDKRLFVENSGTATTTRFWHCKGGACGCGFGTDEKNRYCNANAMFEAPRNNPWSAKYYGTAAVS